MRYIICHDIPYDKTRGNIVNYLERFAWRVQYSVFSCRLDRAQAALVWKDLLAIADANEGNSVLMVPLRRRKKFRTLRSPARSFHLTASLWGAMLKFRLKQSLSLWNCTSRFFTSTAAEKLSVISSTKNYRRRDYFVSSKFSVTETGNLNCRGKSSPKKSPINATCSNATKKPSAAKNSTAPQKN